MQMHIIISSSNYYDTIIETISMYLNFLLVLNTYLREKIKQRPSYITLLNIRLEHIFTFKNTISAAVE